VLKAFYTDIFELPLPPGHRLPMAKYRMAAALLSERIAVYSPHTALDAAAGGTNDTLATLAGATNLRPFNIANKPTKECKLVTFVPHDHAPWEKPSLFKEYTDDYPKPIVDHAEARDAALKMFKDAKG